MFPKYKLTDRQIQGIANIVLHEQGTVEGWYAEASQIANRTDINGDKYATGTNAVKTVTSGWYAKGRSRYEKGTKREDVIQVVKNVFCKGLRTLPRYINEHDCMSDISSVKTGNKSVKGSKSKWVAHKTVIRNRMGSTYRFYSFPGGYKTGVDPFGYTYKSSSDKQHILKYGDYHYTVAQAKERGSKNSSVKFKYPYSLPVLPDKSFGVDRKYYQLGDGNTTLKDYKTQIKRIQLYLKWYGLYKGDIDGIYSESVVKAVKDFQKKQELPANGKFGNLCLEKAKSIKK